MTEEKQKIMKEKKNVWEVHGCTKKLYDSICTTTWDDEVIAGELDLEGHKVKVEVTVFGKYWHSPEKRVPGNPAMIEEFESRGRSVEGCRLNHLWIDGIEQPKAVVKQYQDKYGDVLWGYAEDYDEKKGLEWEYLYGND